MIPRAESLRSVSILGLTSLLLFAAGARADDASPWADDLRSATRLIAAKAPAGTPQLHAGVEIKLKPGWKTYWRYPGDSGVPPRFDFSGSDNVRTAKVSYPAPHAFTDESGTSIGYKDAVIFPVTVTPRDPAKPTTLRLKLDYAVCEKLCVPAEASMELPLNGTTGAQDAAIKAAEAQVPVEVSAKSAGLVARRVTATPKPRVTLDIAARKDGAYQVFVEGPNPAWAIPIPKAAPGAPAGHRHFEFELDGIPPGVDPMGPLELTFTIVGGERPTMVTTRLD